MTSPADARAIATELVTTLGGTMAPATSAGSDALPVDLSFGAGDPVVPCAPRESIARMLLERHLPAFVLDTRRALELASQVERLSEDATIDSLTRVTSRRVLSRALTGLRPGDIVVMLDLDHFKHVNDKLGHDAGDSVLRAFGQVLRECARGTDLVSRYGGEEFVVVLYDCVDAVPFLERLRTAWLSRRPHPVTFSAGFAPVDASARSALTAADRAMYRAKETGRDRWCRAGEGDRT